MIDAAVLWYLLPTIRSTPNGHGKIALCVTAAGVVAVVHGVYDVICGVPFMGPVMEALSLVLLAWLIQIVARLRDVGDTAESDDFGKWLAKLESDRRYFRYLYLGSLGLIILSLLFSWSLADLQRSLPVDSSTRSASPPIPGQNTQQARDNLRPTVLASWCDK